MFCESYKKKGSGFWNFIRMTFGIRQKEEIIFSISLGSVLYTLNSFSLQDKYQLEKTVFTKSVLPFGEFRDFYLNKLLYMIHAFVRLDPAKLDLLFLRTDPVFILF